MEELFVQLAAVQAVVVEEEVKPLIMVVPEQQILEAVAVVMFILAVLQVQAVQE